MTALYDFRAVALTDLPLLADWQSKPHVHEWWGDEPYDEDDLIEPKVAKWIVSYANQPFGFMQDYAVHGWDDHHFAHLPAGARGIDQFIGDATMLGRGHGTGMIAARMIALFAEGAPVIATDPHPDNARAIAVYEKLGFKVEGRAQDTEWGPILPMLAMRPLG